MGEMRDTCAALPGGVAWVTHHITKHCAILISAIHQDSGGHHGEKGHLSLFLIIILIHYLPRTRLHLSAYLTLSTFNHLTTSEVQDRFRDCIGRILCANENDFVFGFRQLLTHLL